METSAWGQSLTWRGAYEWVAPRGEQLAQLVGARSGCSRHVATAALGDPVSAREHYRTAVELSAGLRSPFHRARAMLGLADAVRSTDAAEAAALLTEGVTLAERYRMPGQAEHARRLAG